MAAIQVKKRHTIRKAQITRLMDQLHEQLGTDADLFSSDRIEIAETAGQMRFYLVDKKPYLFENQGWVFPTLMGAVARTFPSRRVVVDSGAVRFVVNGADIMRPGIVSVTPDVKAGAPVVIVEERHNKPLAIGVALYDAAEMLQQTTGKMVRSVHHVGDEIWNLEV